MFDSIVPIFERMKTTEAQRTLSSTERHLCDPLCSPCLHGKKINALYT